MFRKLLRGTTLKPSRRWISNSPKCGHVAPVPERCTPTTGTNIERFTPTTVVGEQHHTNIEWGDHHTSTFLNAWLRDHCHCSDCYDTTTAQRSSDTLLMGHYKDIRATRITVTDNHQQLNVDIESHDKDRHTCVFPLEWLRNHCYSSAGKEERRQALHHQREPWDPPRLRQLCIANGDCSSTAAAGVPSTPYHLLPSRPTILRDQLQQYGLAFVSDVPIPQERAVEQCKTIVETTVRDYLGFPRETLWETLWDTAVSEDATDTA